ncbi:transposase [Candidatus Moduliflexus flocculans]|uniref:Transposase n=1 Tax=Candidatus Moduliflexus flocculans TaxID=1499966 RepID=A0A0S6VTP7_9BACT|nr:transposase [Candidatus Moduliflexus flocculans]
MNIKYYTGTLVFSRQYAHRVNHWRKRQWCISQVTSEYLMRMEDVLDVYDLPYDPRHPVICLDERPCQLLGDTVIPLPMTPGQPTKEEYQYERHGVCRLFVAVEPLAGRRVAQVRPRRTKEDYAAFMQALAAQYPQTERLRVVQDNVNPHTAGSFSQAFDPATAWALKQRFECHATPPHASWLNMAEIELSAIARQCLNRRIASLDELEREVLACVKERNEQQRRITWRFTTPDARVK